MMASRTTEWRWDNPDAVERYNAKRRAAYRAAHPLPTRPCAVCGEPFVGRADALVCRERCRRLRKNEQTAGEGRSTGRSERHLNAKA